jgi:hypothetical protein
MNRPGNNMAAARTSEVQTEIQSFNLGFSIDAW